MLFRYGAFSFRQAEAVSTEYLQATKRKIKFYEVNLKKKKIPEDEHLKTKANGYLNFFSWSIFSLTPVKQQLKSAPLTGSALGVWQLSPIRMELPALSGTAAFQTLLQHSDGLVL